MRFGLAHKVSTYLMVVCSFLALVTSGELSPVAVLLAAVGIAASWRWEPPRVRVERWAKLWTGLTLLVFAYDVVSVLAGADILLIGAEFLMVLLVAKLFLRRAPKDTLHVYVLSFLMLVAGTVLNAEITYGVFFLGYVVASTWALMLFHLRREIEDSLHVRHESGDDRGHAPMARVLASRRIVGGRFFAGTSLISLTIFAAATVLFLAIPRIGFGLFFAKSRGGLTMAGFSDGVELGGHGVIKSDTTVVMRVHVDDTHAGRRAPSLHWRGVAFDEYRGGQWRRSRRAPETRRQVTLEDSDTVHHLLYDRRDLGRADLAARTERAMRQEIYLEPLGYDVLFGASMPVAFEFESRWRERAKGDVNDEIRHPHTAGIKYVVYSDPEPPSPVLLRGATGELPAGFEAYLQVPPELPERVAQLAEEITAGETTAYGKAAAIETWLRSNLDYTLTMESPGRQEPIDFFLFDRRRGHCEYFSSAMAMMTRAVGVPSRNVNGFLGGEWNEYDEYIAVRAGDAHSWVEVFVAGHGWVTFDPTPSAEVDQLGRGAPGVLAKLRRLADTVRFKWFKWVIEYDLYRQMRLFQKVGQAFRGGAKDLVRGRTKAVRSWTREHEREVAAVVLGVGGVLLAVGLLRRRRREDEDLLPRRPVRRRTAVGGHYLSALRRLARRGHRRDPAHTPREHARALTRAGVPGAAELTELTEIYYAVAYGQAADDDLAPRARALRDAIAAAPRKRRAARP